MISLLVGLVLFSSGSYVIWKIASKLWKAADVKDKLREVQQTEELSDKVGPVEGHKKNKQKLKQFLKD